MQVTLGEDGSGSKEEPLFVPLFVAGNMGEAWPPFKLPLFLSLLLSEVDREICAESLARPGLKIDFEGSFMEDEDRREVKQMKSSLVVFVVVPVLLLRCGGFSLSISCVVGRMIDEGGEREKQKCGVFLVQWKMPFVFGNQ